MKEVQATDVVMAFDQEFADEFATRLQGGAAEPYYQVLTDGSAVIYFRDDFVASALHEVAHWCLAGRKRRQQDDYGYWYDAKRDIEAQRRFEAVEVKPQALEWIFSAVIHRPFRVSVDNLDLPDYDTEPFQAEVKRTAREMLVNRLVPRAQRFAVALNSLVAAPSTWCEIKRRLTIQEVLD